MAQSGGNLIIGSSNVYRLYTSTKFSHPRVYKAIKCTQALSFDAHMSAITKDYKFVLISVIENFITDAVSNENEPEAEIVHCLKTFIKVVGETAGRLPDTKFSIVTPLQRPAHKWYQTNLAEITEKLEDGIKGVVVEKALMNINITKCSPVSTQSFLDDEIHLTEASAKIFLDHILRRSESYFDSEMILVEDDESEEDQSSDAVRALERRLVALEIAHKTQVKINFANNLVMARMREEIDATSNKTKEDRVVITGLRSKDPMPEENRARIDWLKKISMDLFERIIPRFPGKIFYLSQGKRMDVFLPMVEIKLDKPENALAIRKAFAIKRKEKSLPTNLDTIFITNCVNLATRVRIDILKAIARRITNKDDQAYVSGFISRPMMHIKKAGAPTTSRPLQSFTFTDAVSRFSNLLKKEELMTAYERAGIAFSGQLSQTFVVLKDEDQADAHKLGTSRPWSGARGGARGRGDRGGAGGGSGSSRAAMPDSRGKKRPGSELGNETAKK